ncbi:MAG: hypothetical protein MH825_13185 [Cyanobacteria bacterium]|nr:hypothetical protein [Cyanobacteriota bacterium]
MQSFLNNFNERLRDLEDRLGEQMQAMETRLGERIGKLEILINGSGDSFLAVSSRAKSEIKALASRQTELREEVRQNLARLEELESLRGQIRELKRIASIAHMVTRTPGGLYTWSVLFIGLLLVVDSFVVAFGFDAIVRGLLGL